MLANTLKGVSHWEDFIHIDQKLHIAISEIGGNPLFSFVLEMIHQNISSYYESYPLRSKAMMEGNYQDLCDVVGTIEQGLSDEARALLQRHIRKFNRYMKIENKRKDLRVIDIQGNEF
jgi:DNA-binding FadR family transcriptional regulator